MPWRCVGDTLRIPCGCQADVWRTPCGYFGDTLVLLRDGHIIQSGSFRNFIETPVDDFVRRFISAQRSVGDILVEAGP